MECDSGQVSKIQLPYFWKMLYANIGKKRKYIPRKYEYFVFLIVLQANPIIDISIHNATWNDYKVAKLFNNDTFVG